VPNGSDLQQRWARRREGKRDPKRQNQARDMGEPGLSLRWGFPPKTNSQRQEPSPRESSVRARSCKRPCGTWQDGAHPLGQTAARQGSGLARAKVPLLSSLLHFFLISRLLSSKARHIWLRKKKNNKKPIPSLRQELFKQSMKVFVFPRECTTLALALGIVLAFCLCRPRLPPILPLRQGTVCR